MYESVHVELLIRDDKSLIWKFITSWLLCDKIHTVLHCSSWHERARIHGFDSSIITDYGRMTSKWQQEDLGSSIILNLKYNRTRRSLERGSAESVSMGINVVYHQCEYYMRCPEVHPLIGLYNPKGLVKLVHYIGNKVPFGKHTSYFAGRLSLPAACLLACTYWRFIEMLS